MLQTRKPSVNTILYIHHMNDAGLTFSAPQRSSCLPTQLTHIGASCFITIVRYAFDTNNYYGKGRPIPVQRTTGASSRAARSNAAVRLQSFTSDHHQVSLWETSDNFQVYPMGLTSDFTQQVYLKGLTADSTHVYLKGLTADFTQVYLQGLTSDFTHVYLKGLTADFTHVYLQGLTSDFTQVHLKGLTSDFTQVHLKGLTSDYNKKHINSHGNYADNAVNTNTTCSLLALKASDASAKKRSKSTKTKGTNCTSNFVACENPQIDTFLTRDPMGFVLSLFPPMTSYPRVVTGNKEVVNERKSRASR